MINRKLEFIFGMTAILIAIIFLGYFVKIIGKNNLFVEKNTVRAIFSSNGPIS